MIETFTKKMAIYFLSEALEQVKNDRFGWTEDEMQLALDVFGNVSINKGELCRMIHLSERQVEYLVSIGRLPKGRKLKKNDSKLYWYKRDALLYLKQYGKRTNRP